MGILPPVTLVMIDVQREYVTPGRPLFMEMIGPSLENAGLLLDHARASDWRIIHVRHEQRGPLFTKGGAFVDCVEGFEPLPGETIIIKSQISAFSEPRFLAEIQAAGPQTVHVAGYGSSTCCLAAMVGAPLFGRRFSFVHDASWASSPRIDCTESEAHWHATSVIALHGDVVSTEEIIGGAAVEMADWGLFRDGDQRRFDDNLLKPLI